MTSNTMAVDNQNTTRASILNNELVPNPLAQGSTMITANNALDFLNDKTWDSDSDVDPEEVEEPNNNNNNTDVETPNTNINLIYQQPHHSVNRQTSWPSEPQLFSSFPNPLLSSELTGQAETNLNYNFTHPQPIHPTHPPSGWPVLQHCPSGSNPLFMSSGPVQQAEITHNQKPQTTGHLTSGWSTKNKSGHLKNCAWVPIPLFLGSGLIRQAALTSPVPQIILTKPSGLECELQPAMEVLDTDSARWKRNLQKRANAQLRMTEELDEWRIDNESWEELERRTRAEQWWNFRRFRDLEAEKKNRIRERMLNGEMNVVRVPGLEALPEVEDDDAMGNYVPGSTLKTELDEQLYNMHLQRKDSGYVSDDGPELEIL